MATPKKPTTAPKIIPDEIEVNFVVAFNDEGEYEISQILDGGDYNNALSDTYIEYTSYQVCRVYLPRPKPPEPLILVPQVG